MRRRRLAAFWSVFRPPWQKRKPAVEVIDAVRAAYRRKELPRQEAIRQIRGVVDVTELGAADLLEHDEDARVRYAR